MIKRIWDVIKTGKRIWNIIDVIVAALLVMQEQPHILAAYASVRIGSWLGLKISAWRERRRT